MTFTNHCLWTATLLLATSAPMFASDIIFVRSQHKLTLLDKDGKEVGSWDAYNNVVSTAKPWPNETFKFAYHKKHDDDAPNSAFGSHGNLVFDVTGRSGMGVHSGRADKNGPKHPTEGCIRTSDEAMKALLELHKKDPLKTITVKD
jgi:hypothetical protein